ncbi:hypothetical protein L3X38_040696 [Prunus dulcis]|uniref:Transposable element protein n=1 Tax=Prunus dulcis TaxID=3755 RepID=A0AAD4V9Y1_PRUDU|nr:hypothetical protein L3X38_040696 [Prunus dulcis]
MVTSGIVLGHIVSHKGIEVDKSKLDLIANLPIPNTVKEIRSFLGHAGFYRRFIQNFSAIARPLNNLLEKDAKFDWNYACQEAFEKLITMLTSTPVMQPPNWISSEEPSEYLPIKDSFPDEQVFGVSKLPWFAKIVNFLATCLIPPHWTLQEKKKLWLSFDEVRNDAYENPQIYKERTKLFREKNILRKNFEPS